MSKQLSKQAHVNNARRIGMPYRRMQRKTGEPLLDNLTESVQNSRERLRARLLQARAEGRYDREIAPFLSGLQQRLISLVILTEYPVSLRKFARAIGCCESVIHNAIVWLDKKLTVLESGKWFMRLRVRQLVTEQLASGETLDQIKERARLSGAERKALEHYVLADPAPTLNAVAQSTGHTTATIVCALPRIRNKLLGKSYCDHLKMRYVSMSDAELQLAVRNSGATSRKSLHTRNMGLCCVVRERGLLYGIFPRKSRSGILAKLKRELKLQLQNQRLEEILVKCSPLEKDIILRLVLARDVEPPGFLVNNYGLRGAKTLRLKEIALLRKLRELPTKCITQPLLDLRAVVGRIGTERMRRLQHRMSKKEQEILASRVYAVEPDSLTVTARRWSTSRERVRQIEKGLLEKLRSVSNGPDSLFIARKTSISKCVRQLRLINEALAGMGDSVEVGRRLSPLERDLLARVAMQPMPSLAEVAGKHGLTVVQVRRCQHTLSSIKLYWVTEPVRPST